MELIGKTIFWLDSVDSTNEELARWLARDTGTREGTVVAAHEQRQGKGMGENTWESEPGLNLTFSFFVRPGFLEAHRQFYLNMAVSMGMCHALRTMLPGRLVVVKWPNDIYAEGGKIAGILIQNSISGNHIEHAIVGIGLNVNQTAFSPEIPNPASLRLASGRPHDREVVLQAVLGQLNTQYRRVMNGDLRGCASDFRKDLYGFSQWRPYRYQGRELIARITGIEETGELILETEGKEQLVCGMKEIEYLF